jgi:hypoxanthine phosphoribosyltransferase
VVLIADLIRQLEMPLRVGVVMASSYRGATTTRGSLIVNSDLMPDISGRHVLLVDDIFDTGHTIAKIAEHVQQMGPVSLRTAVLLRKQGRQQIAFEPHFVGFEIPNEFVVGYGLDYQDAYRNLPYVAALEPAEIENAPP